MPQESPQQDGSELPTLPQRSALPRRSGWGVLRRVLRMGLLLGLCVTAGGIWWAWRAAQQVPDFYRQAALVAPEQIREADAQLRAEVEALTASMRREDQWQATFTEQELNAWLQQEWPRSLAAILPRNVTDPRLAIEQGAVWLAARYRGRRVDTVVSCRLDFSLTEVPNQIACRIGALRAGALPLPKSKLLERVQTQIRESDLPVTCTETEEGDWVALITVPTEHPKYVRSPLHLEAVEVGRQRITVSGRSGDAEGGESTVPQ